MVFEDRVWIGSPCSGKTTVSDILSRRLNLPCYHADEYFERHASMAPGTALSEVIGWSFDQIFLRPVEEMLKTLIQVGHDEFPLILNDIRASDHRIIEGCAVLPESLAALGIDPTHCVYVIPSEAFQRRTYKQREWVTPLLSRSRQPELAWENWRQRDALYSSYIREQAALFGYPVVDVEGERSLEEVADLIQTLLSRNRPQSNLTCTKL